MSLLKGNQQKSLIWTPQNCCSHDVRHPRLPFYFTDFFPYLGPMGRKTGKRTRSNKKKRQSAVAPASGKRKTGDSEKQKCHQRNVASAVSLSRSEDLSKRGSSRSVKMLIAERSSLYKKQAKERSVLKRHLVDLKERRERIRKGDTAKMDRRELGKYIRQLRKEQTEKHEDELRSVEETLHRLRARRQAKHEREANDEWTDVESDVDEMPEGTETTDPEQLRAMFANLTA